MMSHHSCDDLGLVAESVWAEDSMESTDDFGVDRLEHELLLKLIGRDALLEERRQRRKPGTASGELWDRSCGTFSSTPRLQSAISLASTRGALLPWSVEDVPPWSARGRATPRSEFSGGIRNQTGSQRLRSA